MLSGSCGHLRAGIDVGSTTVKLAVPDADDILVFSSYEKRRADIQGTLVAVIEEAFEALSRRCPAISLRAAITGSGGLAVSRWLDLPFVQEVIAGSRAPPSAKNPHGRPKRLPFTENCCTHLLLIAMGERGG